jgi:hypothetical protein
MPTPDPTTTADWLRKFFVRPGQAVELRVIFKNSSIAAGFFDFDHIAAMVRLGLDMSQQAGVKGVYFTLNPVNLEVLQRPGSNNQVTRARKGGSASEADILCRQWLFIDADPRRPTEMAGHSAADEEKAKAKTKVVAIRDHLTGLGWPAPLLCDSGNGYHLLYRVELPVDDGGLTKRVLEVLAGRFDDEAVEIDRSVHDAARITKLYGSKACKGQSTEERPHRWTAILEAPQALDAVPGALLE